MILYFQSHIQNRCAMQHGKIETQEAQTVIQYAGSYVILLTYALVSHLRSVFTPWDLMNIYFHVLNVKILCNVLCNVLASVMHHQLTDCCMVEGEALATAVCLSVCLSVCSKTLWHHNSYVCNCMVVRVLWNWVMSAVCGWVSCINHSSADWLAGGCSDGGRLLSSSDWSQLQQWSHTDPHTQIADSRVCWHDLLLPRGSAATQRRHWLVRSR